MRKISVNQVFIVRILSFSFSYLFLWFLVQDPSNQCHQTGAIKSIQSDIDRLSECQLAIIRSRTLSPHGRFRIGSPDRNIIKTGSSGTSNSALICLVSSVKVFNVRTEVVVFATGIDVANQCRGARASACGFKRRITSLTTFTVDTVSRSLWASGRSDVLRALRNVTDTQLRTRIGMIGRQATLITVRIKVIDCRNTLILLIEADKDEYITSVKYRRC